MVYVEPNIHDYKTILGWYAMLFGKNGRKPNSEDERVYRKFLTMQEAEIEEKREMESWDFIDFYMAFNNWVYGRSTQDLWGYNKNSQWRI